jgi:rubrerythrin
MEAILAEEEDHANDLRTLIESLGNDEHDKTDPRR